MQRKLPHTSTPRTSGGNACTTLASMRLLSFSPDRNTSLDHNQSIGVTRDPPRAHASDSLHPRISPRLRTGGPSPFARTSANPRLARDNPIEKTVGAWTAEEIGIMPPIVLFPSSI